MGEAPPIGEESPIETRLRALEVAVARLSMHVEPHLTVGTIAAPIASASMKEVGQHDFSAKFFALLDLGESLIKYSAALGFASQAQGGRSTGESAMNLFKVSPTLGAIARGLRVAIDDKARSDWPIDVMRDVFYRQNGKLTPTARYLFDEFIELRNKVRGHGAQQAEGYYESLYLKHHLNVRDCVKACRHIQLPLVHVYKLDHVANGFAYKAMLLMGAAPTERPEPIVTSVKAPLGATCLWDDDGRLLPLHHFVSYRYCPTCGLEHVFFAERITAERVYFHSYIGNHRLVMDRGQQ